MVTCHDMCIVYRGTANDMPRYAQNTAHISDTDTNLAIDIIISEVPSNDPHKRSNIGWISKWSYLQVLKKTVSTCYLYVSVIYPKIILHNI